MEVQKKKSLITLSSVGAVFYLYMHASRPAEGYIHRLCSLINIHSIIKQLFAGAGLRKRRYFKTKIATMT